ANGIDEATFRSAPRCYSICNTNSPLQLDVPMTDGIIDFAANGQLMIVTPFTLAGAMAPITISGALTLSHAEALFGITLSQIVRPGAPVMYGSFTSTVDMKSGAPASGVRVTLPSDARMCRGLLRPAVVLFVVRRPLLVNDIFNARLPLGLLPFALIRLAQLRHLAGGWRKDRDLASERALARDARVL